MKITVITATVDSDDVLREALSSVAAQTHPDVEHLVIDSAGVERSPSLLAEFPKVKFIPMPRKGVYAALNCGLKHATGDVVGFVHGNDRLAAPDVLARIADAFRSDPYLGFVFGDLRYFHPRTGRLGHYFTSGDFHPGMLRHLETPPHPTLYVRRELAHRVGPYSTRYVIASDLDWWLRLFAVPGVRWRHLPGVMVYMSYGGISNRLRTVLFQANREKLDIMRRHNIKGGVLILMRKYISALSRLFRLPVSEQKVINTCP